METRTRGSQERRIIEDDKAEKEGEGRVEPSQGMVAREEEE